MMYDTDTVFLYVNILFSELKKAFITYVKMDTSEHLEYCI